MIAGFGCWGIDCSYAELSVMEKICFNPEAIGLFWDHYMATSPIQELVVLSTCNRVEFYFYAQDPDMASDWLLRSLAQFRQIQPDFLKGILHYRQNREAIAHLFRVVCGIESMVFGENEILAQVKESLSTCHRLHTTGAFLNKLFQSAVTTGKRVRKETLISRGAYSISSIAVEALREQLPAFEDASLLVIGAGTMSLRAIKKLKALDHPNLTICNRSEDKLVRLAEKYTLKILPYSQLATKAEQYHGILLVTSSDTYVLTPEFFSSNAVTKVIVDVSVPRNANPAIQSNKLCVLSVQDLKAIVDRTIQTRRNELVHIQSILDEEQRDFERWLQFKQGLCATVS